MSSHIEEVFARCRWAIKYVFLFSAAINVLSMFMPLYTLQVLDRVANTGNMSTLFLLTFIAAFALTVMTFIEGARRFLLARIGEWMERELSRSLILGSFMMGAAQQRSTGAQVIRDLGAVKSFIVGNACTSLFDAPWSVLFFICVWIINPATGVVTLVGIVLLVLFALVSEKMTTPMLKKINEGHSRNLQDLDTASRNAETIEAMGMGGSVAELWLRRQDKISEISASTSARSNIIALALRYVRMSLQIAVYCAGIVYALRSGGTIGGVIASSILISRVMAPFESFVSSWKTMVSARMAYSRLKAMQGYCDLNNSSVVHGSIDMKGMIRVDNLVFAYPGARQPALRGISFILEAGESMAVFGPSGAGKTTLLKAVLGLIKPLNGLVMIDNVESGHWDKEFLGKFVGFVGQNPEFFEATVRDNIARIRDDYSPDMAVGAAQVSGAHSMILAMPKGYDTIIGGGAGVPLSAGQKQRLALARAMFGEIKILILDEPTSNLDREGEQYFFNMLRHAKERGITTIVVTHNAACLQYVDKVMVMQNGVMVSCGKRDEVASAITARGAEVKAQ